MASFNDSRCSTIGVCSSDPILFTCELKEVILLRVVLPTGDQEFISVGNIVSTIDLPAGFATVSLDMSEINECRRNISLTFSIAIASLLDYGYIRCDDTQKNVVTARCPLLGKSEHYTKGHI